VEVGLSNGQREKSYERNVVTYYPWLLYGRRRIIPCSPSKKRVVYRTQEGFGDEPRGDDAVKMQAGG